MILAWFTEYILHSSFVWGEVEFFLQLHVDDDSGTIDLCEYDVGAGLADPTMEEKANRVGQLAEEVRGLDIGSAQRFIDTFITLEVEGEVENRNGV